SHDRYEGFHCVSGLLTCKFLNFCKHLRPSTVIPALEWFSNSHTAPLLLSRDIPASHSRCELPPTRPYLLLLCTSFLRTTIRAHHQAIDLVRDVKPPPAHMIPNMLPH